MHLPAFGVVTDDALLIGALSVELDSKKFKSFSDLFELAEGHELKQIWITPDSKLYGQILTKSKSFFERNSPDWTLGQSHLKNSITGWRERGRGGKIVLIIPGAVGQNWPLDSVSDPARLILCIRVLAHVLGYLPTYPQGTSIELLTRTAGKWVRAPVGDLKPFAEHTESDLFFKRPLADSEKELKYLHAIDKKKAYRTASETLSLGLDKFQRELNPDFRNVPGLWRVTLKGNPFSFNNLILPKSREFEFDKPRWMYTPMILLATLPADKGGLNLKAIIHEAYVFDSSARVFSKFVATLREGERKITESKKLDEESKAITLGCLKALYTRFTGWLAAEKENKSLQRRDWRGMIVSQTKANVIRAIAKGFDYRYGVPVGVRNDNLIYLSNEPDPHKAYPELLVGPHAQFKVNYTLPAAVALPLLESNMSIQTIDNDLKKIAEGKLTGGVLLSNGAVNLQTARQWYVKRKKR